MSIGFFFAITAFLLVSMTKRKWLAWVLVAAFVVASFLATGAYLHALHSPAFPEALLDDSGRAWKAMCRRIQEDERIKPKKSLPQPSPPLPASAGPEQKP